MITLQNVSKTYGAGEAAHQALKDIHLSVARGEIFGIMGKSGAGKSTLLRLLNLLETPTSGQVVVNNVDLTLLSRDELRKKRLEIGMIFQHFNLLSSRTAYENVALPLELTHTPQQEIKERVNGLLRLVELSDRASYYPGELSGGQKQRVAIARALALNPKILLSDEATSSLDPQTTHSILQLLKNINRELGLTIVLITHEMEVIKAICDRAVILDEGKIIEQGDVLTLFTRPQTEIAKNFVFASLQAQLPPSLSHALHAESQFGYPVLRLTFIGNKTGEPVMASLLDKFGVKTNILRANLERIHDETVGVSICEFFGEAPQISDSIAFLESEGILTEVLGYVN